MKTLLALLLLIPSLSWGDKITFRCSGLDGYFVLKEDVFSDNLAQYHDDGRIFYYEKTNENDVFVNFKYKKMENTDVEITGVDLLVNKLKEKETLKYNKLNNNLLRYEEKHDCYLYDKKK